LLLCAAPAARAQDGNAIGNPQLRDFQLRPQSRQQPPPLTQPVQQAPAPIVVAPPPATARPQAAPPAQQPQPQPQAQPAQPLRIQPLPPPAAPAQAAPARAQPQAVPPAQPQAARPQAPAPAPETAPPPEAAPALPAAPPAPSPAAAPPAAEAGSAIPWLYVLPAAALALIGLALLLRRRRKPEAEAYVESEVEAPASAAPAPLPEPAPRGEPVPRPWLELSLKAERASATLTETVVQFELEITNTGMSQARNLRIDVKMFNAGQEQDREIGAFFRTAGRETTKLNLPGIAAQSSGVIRGEVAMPRDEMRAVVLDDKYLFVPVIAVNALYDWGEGRSGQSSKSYVVGRELEQPGEKMGAFRVDQGPRVWRAIGQRQHSLAKRV
jgi:hypothetical protein